MAGSQERFVYRVVGFGNQVEHKALEFTKELAAVCVCRWCGVVTKQCMNLRSCGDIVCGECSTRANCSSYLCPVHGKRAVYVSEVSTRSLNSNGYDIEHERVRCVNVMRGCQFLDKLSCLDAHLRDKCAFNIIECVRCWRGVPYKDMRSHFSACRGATGASRSSSAAVFLVDDLANARNELDHALASANLDDGHADLRKAVISASDMFARLETQLGMAGSTISGGAFVQETPGPA